MIDKKIFKQLIEPLFTFYGATPTRETLAVYYGVLGALDERVLAYTILQAYKECKWMPRPSEMLEVYKRKIGEHINIFDAIDSGDDALIGFALSGITSDKAVLSE